MAAGMLAGCSSSSGTETTASRRDHHSSSSGVRFGETEAEAADSESTEAAAGETGDKPFAGQSLTISTFAFNAELLQKNVYDPFMEQTGCELIVEGGKNAERVTKIKENPSAYDVVIIGDSFITDLINEGLIAEIDSSKLTNLDALYDCAKAPFGEQYGPAYTFNPSGHCI